MLLLNRLKYPQKFLLISAVFLIPLALLLILFLSEGQSRIDFARKERYGVQYLQPLQELVRHVSEYRLLQERSTLLPPTTPQLTPLRSQITQDLQALEAVDQSLDAVLDSTRYFRPLLQTWEQGLTHPTVSGHGNESEGTGPSPIQGQMDALRFQIGDQSNLILDPDLDSYYLMDTVLLTLPELQKQLSQVEHINQHLLRQQLSDRERSQLIVLQGSLAQLHKELGRKLEVSFHNNPSRTLEAELRPTLERINRSLEPVTQWLNNVAKASPLSQPPAYHNQTHLALEASSDLWQQSLTALDQLLQHRMKAVRVRQVMLCGLVFLMLAIAAYLFVGFYLGVMQTVFALSAASQRMVDGTFTEPIALNSNDELAEVVQSFNTVADALREAEGKYRSIFENAVEGIFQTSLSGQYLIANPMLARIYGYSSPEALIASLNNIAQQLYVNPERRHEFAQRMQTEGQIQGFESEVYRQDGSKIWISESARFLRNLQGEVVGYEGTVEDITARKQAEAEIAQLTQRLKDENLRMHAELDITRKIQHMLLPSEAELKAVAGLDIAGFMEPADEVGGDYYDVLHQDGKVRISIGDVTGHGLESGVVMIMAQTAVRTLLAQGETDPAKFLNVVNHIIYENTRRMRSHKNMTLALLEYEAGILRLSGQHEELILVRQDGTIEQIDTLDLGFPLGIESDITPFVAEKEIQLHPGDIAVLYTDGITEAMNMKNEQYGLTMMHQVIQQHRHQSASDIRRSVIASLKQYIGEQKVFDDITLLVMKQT